MNSSTMCILACIAAVLAVTGPGGGLGQGRGARSACVTARRDAKLPSLSILHAEVHAKHALGWLALGAVPVDP